MQQPDDSGALKAYWYNGGINFGDTMNQDLLQGLTGYKVEWSDDPEQPLLTAAGSLIGSFFMKGPWTVWGSGCISKETNVPKNLDIRAVRGQLTRQHLLNIGYSNIPEVYGDPGLLLPLLFPAPHDQEPQYDWGIIPHYSFRFHPAMHAAAISSKLTKACGIDTRSISVISPKLSTAEFLKRVLSCRYIASSSLHGLIVAAAYGKPFVWIAFEGDPFEGRVTSPALRDLFKYHDFFSSIGMMDMSPIVIRRVSDWVKAFDSVTEDVGNFDPKPLMDAFPYKPPTWDEQTLRAEQHFKNLKKDS